MTTRNFYQITVEYTKGSCFDEDYFEEYYQDYQMAKCSFEEFEKACYHAFEVRYDSAEIFVHTVQCLNGVWVTTVSAENENGESDLCQIKRKELKMFV